MSSRKTVLLVLVLFTFLGMAVLFAAWNLRSTSRVPASDIVLVYDVPFRIDESATPARGLVSAWASSRGPYLLDVITAIRRAATDEHVLGLVLRIDLVDWGWAKVEDLREAVQAFQATGKPVVAELMAGGDLEYYLGSVADHITLPPQARLNLDGLNASAMFLGAALEKLDIRPNFVRAGVYKSAPEQYTRTGMSAPAREALQQVVDDLYGILVDSLATARDLLPTDVTRLLDSGPFTAQEAWELGLVDTLMYRADLDSLLEGVLGESVDTRDLVDYIATHKPSRTGDRIAIVQASGTILPGANRGTPGDPVLGSETTVRALHDARTRSSIKAVVLRVDSPGGVMQAADDIWREARRLAEDKPLIVSMSDVAASGGYYIAAPARTIVAQPATITGSIGVFVGKFNVSGLLNKLGISVESVSRGAHAGMLSPFRDFSNEEREWLQAQTDDLYRTFLDRVSEGRGLDVPQVDAVAQGRVWTGLAAHDLGLVDTLGGLSLAMDLAREAADLGANSAVEVLPRVERPWYQSLIESAFGEGGEGTLQADDPTGLTRSVALRAWLAASRLQDGRVMALMPWAIQVR